MVVSSSSNAGCCAPRVGSAANASDFERCPSIAVAARATAPTRRKSRRASASGCRSFSELVRCVIGLNSRIGRLRGDGERGLKAIHELRLRGVHLLLRHGRVEPGAPVDFGKLDPSSRSARPFGAHGVAHDGCGVGVAFPGPGVNKLAGLLAYAAEGEERAEWADAGLFLELATGGVEEVLAFLDDALRDRPGAGVAVTPEGAAGMRQEHFDGIAPPPEEQEPGADVRTRVS